jgi:hypothetical protein
MKQKLIALLKTLFASKGFNAKELDGLADLVIAQSSLSDESTDEDLQTASDAAKPVADFVQSVASRQVTDVKKPKPVEVKPIVPEAETPDVDPNETPTEKMLRQALAGITALTAEVATIKSEKVGNTRREQYAKALEGTSEAYKTAALKDFDRLSFKDDDDYAEWLGEKSESAKVFAQEETNNGLGGERPVGGTGGGNASNVKLASDTELDAVMENL